MSIYYSLCSFYTVQKYPESTCRTLFLEKLSIKNLKIKTRIIWKFPQEPSELHSSGLDPLKTLLAERILNALPLWTAIANLWRNQSTSLESHVASTRWRPIALKMTPVDGGPIIHSHGFECKWLKLMCLCKSSVYTALALLGSICSGASYPRWRIQVHPSKSINTRAIPNQTPTITKREGCYTIRAWPISSNPGSSFC